MNYWCLDISGSHINRMYWIISAHINTIHTHFFVYEVCWTTHLNIDVVTYFTQKQHKTDRWTLSKALQLSCTKPSRYSFSVNVFENQICKILFDRLQWGLAYSDISITAIVRDRMAAIFQTTFSNTFPWMKMYKFRLRLHWSLYERVQSTIFQNWFRWWLGPTRLLSEPMMLILLTHICVTRSQCVNT